MDRFDLIVSFAVKLDNRSPKLNICPVSGILSVNDLMVEYSAEAERFINDAAAFMHVEPAVPVPGSVYFAGMETPYVSTEVTSKNGKTYPSLNYIHETQHGLFMVDDTASVSSAADAENVANHTQQVTMHNNTYTVNFNNNTYVLTLSKLPAIALTTNSTEGAHLYINNSGESKYAISNGRKFIFHGSGNYYVINDDYYIMLDNMRFEIALFIPVADAPNTFKKPIGVNVGELLHDANEQKITIKIGEDFDRLYCYDTKIEDAYFNANVDDFPISLLIDNKIYKCCLVINDGTYEFLDSDYNRVNVVLTKRASIVKNPAVPMTTIFKFEKARSNTDEFIKLRNNSRRKNNDTAEDFVLEDDYKSYALTHIQEDTYFTNNILPSMESVSA